MLSQLKIQAMSQTQTFKFVIVTSNLDMTLEKFELGENQVWAWCSVRSLYPSFWTWTCFLNLRKPDHILGHIYVEIERREKALQTTKYYHKCNQYFWKAKYEEHL